MSKQVFLIHGSHHMEERFGNHQRCRQCGLCTCLDEEKLEHPCPANGETNVQDDTN